MRNYFKYGLLSFFIAFCYNIEITEDAISCATANPETHTQTQFIALRSPHGRQDVTNLCRYCSEMLCKLTENTQDIRLAKHIVRKASSFHKYRPEQRNLQENHCDTYAFRWPSPVSYYIFGLRKIIT